MADQAEASPVTDWRGTPITEGALVIYGAPVGRSIALVEGTVDGFTKTGRVNVRVRHRAYGGWSDREVVHVGPDRLTIVAELPPTDLPLLGDEIAERKARQAERKRKYDSHDFPESYQEEVSGEPLFRGLPLPSLGPPALPPLRSREHLRTGQGVLRMTTANHAVLANAIHALDGTRDNGAQVIFTVEEPELAPTSASIGVEVHDVVADERRLFTVTIQEV